MDKNFFEKYNQKVKDGFEDINSSSKEEKDEFEIDVVKKSSSSMRYEEESDFSAPAVEVRAIERRKFPVTYIGIGIAVIIAIIVIFMLLNRQVTVPDMLSWTKTDAQLWADENQVILRFDEEYSNDVTQGRVMSQSPQEGDSVGSGSFVELVVSLGPNLDEKIQLPDIENMTASEVDDWATENQMTRVRVTFEESSTVEKGEVINFTVNDDTVFGDEVNRDTPIYVVYSSGIPEGEPVEIPDFSPMTKEQAVLFGEENGIKVVIEEEFSDTVLKGSVIKQSIKAEEFLKSGEEIIITISLGEEILIPDFSKYSREQASVVASQNGIIISVKDRYSDYSKEAMIYQSHDSGELYQEGDIIELTYSLGNSFVISSFVGQSLDSLNSWYKPLNEQGGNIKVKATYTVSDKPAGTILSQDKENKSIGIWETINVVVSEGAVIYAPDLVGESGSPYSQIMTREKAIVICENIGIVPVFIAEESENRLQGEVWFQSVSAGAQIKQGSVIEIKYVPIKDAYTVPDFSGLTESEIVSSGYDKQFEINFSVGEYLENMDNKVVMQSVGKGTTVAPGTVINLIVGAEKIVEPVIPDVDEESPNEEVQEEVVDELPSVDETNSTATE